MRSGRLPTDPRSMLTPRSTLVCPVSSRHVICSNLSPIPAIPRVAYVRVAELPLPHQIGENDSGKPLAMDMEGLDQA